MSVRVLIVRPAATADGWEWSELREAAAGIRGVELACDIGGEESHRVGAETSGLAVLTDPDGQVVFRGGLTRARGREGDAPGRRAILDWVGGRTGASEAPVFGCPLFNLSD